MNQTNTTDTDQPARNEDFYHNYFIKMFLVIYLETL